MSTHSPLSLPLASEELVRTTSLHAAAFVYAYDPHSLIFIDDAVVPFHFVFQKRSQNDLRKYERGEAIVEPKTYTHAIGQLRGLIRDTRNKKQP